MTPGFSSSSSQRYRYFQSVAAAYSDYLQALQSFWADRETLHQGLETLRDEAIATLTDLPFPQHQTPPTPQGVGLNTVGLLTDRLTILTIKEWNLRYRHDNPNAAQQLHAIQIQDILEALAAAAPAKAALNSKLTTHTATLQADRWPAAAYDLFATNLLIWKAQDYLYSHSLQGQASQSQALQGQSLSPDSSRLVYTYTMWLPKMNVQRDALIQRCEQLYWRRG